MNFSTYLLIICLLTGEYFSSCYAGLLFNLLLGGNNGQNQQGPNLPFLNFNNNQNTPNDYQDYNLGTSRDMNYDRVNDYDTSQQQSYPINEARGGFNQQPENFNQNDYSGSQERDYNRNPSNFNNGELSMGHPNIPFATTLNNNNLENNPSQVSNIGYSDGNNANKIVKGGDVTNGKITSKNNMAATTQTPKQYKNIASQNITMNKNQVLPKLHSNDPIATSVNLLPSLDKIINSTNVDTKSPTIVVVKIPPGVTLNKKITEITAETKNVIKTNAKNVLKPITKRKFFFQVKPVLPEPNRVSDMETVFYI